MNIQSMAMPRIDSLSDDLVRMQDNAEVKVNYSQTSVALAMADDLSALLSAMLQNRRSDKNTAVTTDDAKKYAQTLEEKRPESIAKVVSYAKDAGMTPKQLLFVMAQMFNDPADIALLLQAFIQKKKSARQGDAGDELTDVSLTLLEESYTLLLAGPHKRQIKAGVNIQSQTSVYSPQLNLSPEILRGLYHEFITEETDPVEMYQKIIDLSGVQKRHLALEYLVNALQCDIYSHDPSCSLSEFGGLLEKSFIFNVIKSADLLFIEGMKRIDILKSTWEKSEVMVTDFFVALLRDTAQCGDITVSFINRCLKYHTKNDKIEFLQVVQRLMRSLPLFLFSHDAQDCSAIKNSVDHTLSHIMSGFTETDRTGIRYE
nr:HrpJ domain-containing protein [uncultured Enterobacter sp.]